MSPIPAFPLSIGGRRATTKIGPGGRARRLVPAVRSVIDAVVDAATASTSLAPALVPVPVPVPVTRRSRRDQGGAR
jgi:hypothetical protein